MRPKETTKPRYQCYIYTPAHKCMVIGPITNQAHEVYCINYMTFNTIIIGYSGYIIHNLKTLRSPLGMPEYSLSLF